MKSIQRWDGDLTCAFLVEEEQHLRVRFETPYSWCESSPLMESFTKKRCDKKSRGRNREKQKAEGVGPEERKLEPNQSSLGDTGRKNL